MKHAAKFDIRPRGRKTKYYTCQQCGFVCSGWSLKDAREQHKAHLTRRAVDPPTALVHSQPLHTMSSYNPAEAVESAGK